MANATMALSFLEPRITPRGSTFIQYPEAAPPLKRSHSWSGFVPHALRDLSILRNQKGEVPHFDSVLTCSSEDVDEKTNFPTSFSDMDSQDYKIETFFWPDTEEEEEEEIDIEPGQGSIESFDWPDTDEEDSDMDQGHTWRRENYPTWSSEASNSSKLSLAALIPETRGQSHLPADRQYSQLTACAGSAIEGIIRAVPGGRYVGDAPATGGPNSLPLFATAQRPLVESSFAAQTRTTPNVETHEQLPTLLGRGTTSSMQFLEKSFATEARATPNVETHAPLPTLLGRGTTSSFQCSRDKQKSAIDTPSQNGELVTTLMIRNLPSHLCQADLLQELDTSGFKGTYDFVYMPQSFERKESKGFAFINFMSGVVAGMFVGEWHRQQRFNMKAKDLPINVSAATLQGKEENMRKWANQRLQRIKNPQLRPFVLSFKEKA